MYCDWSIWRQLGARVGLITNNARDRRVESPRFTSCLMYCPLSKHPFRLFCTFTCVITQLSVLPARLGTLLEHLTSSLFADYSVLSRVPCIFFLSIIQGLRTVLFITLIDANNLSTKPCLCCSRFFWFVVFNGIVCLIFFFSVNFISKVISFFNH
ncbi:hypothetical protein [Pseudomonas phage vB_PsaM_M1]|nr:hypothetical protein [Pseudomonas phage vB_PsaM_M1]